MTRLEWMSNLLATVEPEASAVADAVKMLQLFLHLNTATKAELEKRLLTIQREQGKSKAEMLPVWEALNLTYPEQ